MTRQAKWRKMGMEKSTNCLDFLVFKNFNMAMLTKTRMETIAIPKFS